MFDASNRTENPRSFDRVFVVEDEFLIAVEICQQLTHAGFEIVGPAASVANAFRFVGEQGCDCTVLDFSLGDETSEPIAQKCKRLTSRSLCCLDTPRITCCRCLMVQRS
jgi:AmiR/NasT family two-component response regulator